ncbi:MAG: UDP-glucose/GDP-mannose dehydrogenase family protein [Pseudomonadota bacterium]
MKISIIGTGYVGIVTGACLAEQGHDVVCVDIDQRKVDAINAGIAPIHEDGLPELLKRNIGKRLRASNDLAKEVVDSEMTMIAVGTPASEGRIDLKYVEAAASQIGTALRGVSRYHTVVVKSTVIPGTTAGTVREHLEKASGKRAGQDFGLGMNPEFLTEGTAVEDFSRPDRLVLGGVDARTHEALKHLYAGFDASVPRILTNTQTAEMIKYASNAVLATMISFSNEIARLSARIGGIDAIDVVRGVHAATYFTSRGKGEPVVSGITSFLSPGCGFGGSCLPKDVTALIGQGRSLGLPLPLLQSVLDINKGQIDEMLALLGKHHASLQGLRVAVLGIAFKPDTDDVRETPAFPLIKRLKQAGAEVTAYDPVAKPLDHEAMQGVTFASSLADAVAQADAVLLVTRWKEFEQLGALLKSRSPQPPVIDGRRSLNPADFARYEGIGRA